MTISDRHDGRAGLLVQPGRPSMRYRLGVFSGLALVLAVAGWWAPVLLTTWLPEKESASWMQAATTAHEWAPWAALTGLVAVGLVVLLGRVTSAQRDRDYRDGPQRTWWSQVPLWARAVVVLSAGAGLVLGGLAVSGAEAVSWSAPAGSALAGSVAVLLGWSAAHTVAMAPHRRQWIQPLHVALAPVLDLPPGTRPSTYLRVPPDYATRPGEVVRVVVPPTWTDADDGKKRAVQAAVSSKLGLSDVSWRWHLAGRSSYVTAVSSPRPPAIALFADPTIRDMLTAAVESAPLIGVQHGGRASAIDLDAESPHILVSAGTGGGKSVILRTVAAQMLHNGALVSVLDVKRHSHKWARGLDAVTYCRDIEDVHDELVRLGVEGDRRNRIVDDWDGEETDVPVGPRMAVLLEEANATIARLKRYWQVVRDPKTDPKESPAIDALREVLFMGRAVRMHVLLVAQSATAAALGGPEMRENFATRILARYTQNAWRMLVPEVTPIPRSTRHIGRAQVVLGGVAYATQVVFMTADEARDWALSGSSPEATIAPSHRPTGPIDLVKHPETVPAGTTGQDGLPVLSVVAEPAEPPLIGLREACDSGVLSVSLAVARKSATGRDPEFPAAGGTDPKTGAKLYRPADLTRWERNRPRADRAAS